jgi:hypothetical protein
MMMRIEYRKDDRLDGLGGRCSICIAPILLLKMMMMVFLYFNAGRLEYVRRTRWLL